MTLEKCKARKEVMESLNDRSGANHGMSAYARKTRRSVLNRYWQRHISDKNGIWYDMPPHVKRPYGRCLDAAVPKDTFSCAMTLMDKVGGWSDEKCVGSNLAACVWIYTPAVLSRPWTWIFFK